MLQISKRVTLLITTLSLPLFASADPDTLGGIGEIFDVLVYALLSIPLVHGLFSAFGSKSKVKAFINTSLKWYAAIAFVFLINELVHIF